MSHPHQPHQLKRLQHDVNSNPNLSSHHQRLPNDEVMRESIQQFSRPFNPGPQQARRGGGGRPCDRHWYSSLNLPTRAINYDLAESFMNHSSDPLSSKIYEMELKHSNKKWPDGRFKNYREKQNKSDGHILEIACTRTFSIVPKRKKIPEGDQNEQANHTTSLLALLDPIVPEEKKKQVDQQTNIYANFFGGGRIPRISATTQAKKPISTGNSTSASVSLLDEPPTHP